MRPEEVYCPVNAWDCPYYKNGLCHIEDPIEDCDDFMMFFEDWDDYNNA